ncbi:glycosyltransferase [Microvirga tunisiensis]|uniref:Glycosyltransferase n=1 Tax=Microvirga tunisiensis TaxID=2108360 RepID=A0A5N7MIL0_9HYPH|nr:glycosyltransferase [Microvirga tunisiensis]MPR08706.1 glycosyltransferase [Microvirga tunisiensis]MPR26911.1 glycosyltransferase [Microvirga tunisiensis]
MRILVLAHGHPDLSSGGGERAAYSLFQRLKQSPQVTKAVFVASTNHQAIGHDAPFGSFRGRPDEILVATPPVDGFTFQSLGYDALKRLVDGLVQSVKPDLVHIHHFLFWGIEVFELFKQAGVRVVFTFHEFAAICAQYGQMVKTDGRLCHAASPGECGLCFPALSAGKFFIRNTILKSLFNHVDCFTAPSNFLMERYVAWGIPRDRITVVENLLGASVIERSKARMARRAKTAAGRAKVVFGYFAQINPFKGFDLLLEAASLLPDDVRTQLTIRIYGENTQYRDTEFHRRTEALHAEVRDVVSLMGGYRGDDVIDLMAACDWIIVPSIWWENSPVVIQEVRLAARPLIVSNIGGMAEKIDQDVDLVFPARSPGALANLIADTVLGMDRPNQKHLTDLAQSRIQADETHFACYCALYDEALTG